MKKSVLTLGIILLFLCMSFVQVNANVDKDIQNPEPTSTLVWKCAMGTYNFNLPNGTRIDYLFKILTNDRLILFGPKISGNWGGTSDIDPIFKAPYNFIRDEYYEVKMFITSLIFFPENFTGKPYIIDDPSGWTKLYGSGYGIKVYQ